MKQTFARPADQDAELKALYKKWPDVKRFLYSLGCTGNDAEDLFQEALVIYIRKVGEPDFVLTVEPFFYVKNTCKLLWYNQSRKQGKQATFSLESDVAELEDDWFRKEQQLKSIEGALAKLGKQCQELLQLFYGLGWSMVDIAQKIGMRNDKVAKAQKYRCLQKAKEFVQADETWQEQYVEPKTTGL